MLEKYCHVFFDEYPKDSRIRRYTNTLVRLDFEVFIVCLSSKGKSFYEKDGKLHIYRIPIKKRRSTFFRRIYEYFLFQIFSTILITYLYLKNKIAIFHSHTLPDFLVFSCLVPKLFGAKIILDFHELFPEFMMQHKPVLDYNSRIIKLLLWQERLSFNFANNIITFHDPAKEILIRRIKSPTPVITIMNGVDESELPAFKKRKSDTFKIIYNGTINFNLNLTLIIKAFKIIKEKRADIFDKMGFYIYGDGPDINNILNLANELNISNVFYEGQLKFIDIVNKLEDADLCILPPKRDIYSDLFYSLKLLEMIYFRIPVLATRLNTYQKYYPEGCLFYFDSENEKELAEKIIYIFGNHGVIEKYTQKAFEEYRKYSWDIMEKRFIKLIEQFQE